MNLNDFRLLLDISEETFNKDKEKSERLWK